MSKLPLHPANPERTCWGCDQYCPAGALTCGNGTDRTPHPSELFGPDWDSELARSEQDVGTESSAVPHRAGSLV